MTIYTAIRPLTGTEFQQMVEDGLFDEDARIELLDGRIHEMAPVGIPHSTIVKRLILHFTDLFHRQYIIQVQDPIALTRDSQPQPDVALLRWRDDVMRIIYQSLQKSCCLWKSVIPRWMLT